MNHSQQMMWDNRILHIITGSFLYGTNVITSDRDEIGISIANKEFYLGLDVIEECDMSVISKMENGKNDENALDLKLYEFRKYIKLAKDNNPNLLDLIHVNDENVLFENEVGKRLRAIKHIFPHKGLVQKYIGYGHSQLHKMHIKPDNYDALKKANDWLMHQQLGKDSGGRYYASYLLAEFRDNKTLNPFIKFYDSHATIGDLNISLTDKLSKVYNKVVDRLSKVGNREELYTKYGFDTKFGGHAIRLLLEGKEYLETGTLEFPLKESSLLLDIRNGKYPKEQIISMSNDLTKELDSLIENCKLPAHPRTKDINNFLISTVEQFWESDYKFKQEMWEIGFNYKKEMLLAKQQEIERLENIIEYERNCK